MSFKLKIWLILGIVVSLVSGAGILLDFYEVERSAEKQMRQQALDLRAALMATRRVYHKQFLASGLPLNEHTLGFLPAHAMSRIAQDYPNWTKSGVRFNNVTDRPRNPANQADADELAAMAWFRANPKAAEYTQTIRSREDGREYFHFTAPIWAEPYCLTCHAAAQDAPPTIRQRYSAGYDYRVGDLRGVMSIRIPVESGRDAALAHWQQRLLEQVVLLLAMLLTLGLLLNHYVIQRFQGLRSAIRNMARGSYSTRVGDTRQDEIAELARGFDAMATVIEQREQALKQSEQQYRILADYSLSWEYWLGPDGRYVYVSPSCRTVCGYPPEDFVDDPALMERLLHPDDLPAWRAHLLQHFRQDGEPGERDNENRHEVMILRIRDRDGRDRWIEHICTALFDADGRFLGRRGANHDITERKRAEELERFSAFQAGIGEMSTSVLHNIGNAITAVSQDAESIEHAGTELLRVASLLDANAKHSQAGLDGQNGTLADLASHQCVIQQEAARAIRHLSADELNQRSRRLVASVRHIADIVHIQQSAARPSQQRSSFSLSQAIHAALELQGNAFKQHGIHVTLQVDPAVDQVNQSHNRLLQALTNIFKNSIEAIQARGMADGFQGRLEIRAEALGGDRLRLSVVDNGEGFEAAAQDDLFRFGFSTKQRGTGFGLHSVAVYAQECGGQVTLRSEGRNLGARLEMVLPRNVGNPARSEQ